MKPIQSTLCFAIAAFTVLPLEAQPRATQFRSLSPSGSQSNAYWVAHLNAMSEAERQRRVRTYGTSPAPANPRDRALRAQPERRLPSLSSSNGAPRSIYQTQAAQPAAVRPAPAASRPGIPVTQARVVAPTVRAPKVSRPATPSRPQHSSSPGKTTSTAAHSITPAPPSQNKITPRASSPRRLSTPVARPQRTTTVVHRTPFQVTTQVTTKTGTTRHKHPSLPRLSLRRLFGQDGPSVASPRRTVPVVSKQPSAPEKTVEQTPSKAASTLRQQLVYTPNTAAGRKVTPWAPYASREAYRRAAADAQWKPLGPTAEKLQKVSSAKPKKRWSLFSLFKRSHSDRDDDRSASASSRKRLSTKVPGSRIVTAGLPQTERSSGPMIETTLFDL